MLRCKDGSLYVGMTNDVGERLREHERGKDSDYTAKRRPASLVWSAKHPNKQLARRREIEIKGWSRRKKLELVKGNPSASG